MIPKKADILRQLGSAIGADVEARRAAHPGGGKPAQRYITLKTLIKVV